MGVASGTFPGFVSAGTFSVASAGASTTAAVSSLFVSIGLADGSSAGATAGAPELFRPEKFALASSTLLRNFAALVLASPSTSGISVSAASKASLALVTHALRMVCAAAASLFQDPSSFSLAAAVYAEISIVLMLSRRSAVDANANCAASKADLALFAISPEPLLACWANVTALSRLSIAESYNPFNFSEVARRAVADSIPATRYFSAVSFNSVTEFSRRV